MSGEFSAQAWRACAKFGIQGLPVPAELGGGGADILTTVLVMEALGYGCHDNGLIFSLNAQMWSLELPLVKFGTPAQQQAYLPGLMSGDLIGVHAMTEPDSGSDAFSMRTRVERQGDGYVLNGTKLYITNAPVADVVLVFAAAPRQARWRASPLPRRQGDARVHRDPRPGQDGPADLADGRGRAGRLPCPGENRLGPEGAGMAIFNSSMDLGRSCILASARGRHAAPARGVRGLRADAQAVRPAHREVPGAWPDKVADMYLRLEAARLLVYQAAWLGQQGKPALARGGRGQAVHERGVGRLQPGRHPGPRGLRLHEGKRHRARPAGRRRQHHLLRYLGDPAGHRGPDAGPVSAHCGQLRGSRGHGISAAAPADGQRGAGTAAAARWPSGERFLTYDELDKLSNQVARALLAQGVAPGDRVGILAPKSAASVVARVRRAEGRGLLRAARPEVACRAAGHHHADSGITVVLADQATGAPGGRDGRQRSPAAQP